MPVDSLEITLEEDVRRILEEYGREAKEVVEEEAKRTADETVKELKAFRKGAKEWKDYPKGWTSKKVDKGFRGVSYTIHNKKRPSLTHLLEKGHAIWNSPKARARSFPHIKPAEEKAKKSFEERVRKRIEDLS